MSKVLKSKRTRIVNVSNPLSDILGIGGVDKKIHEIYVGRSPLLSMLAGAPLDNLNPDQE